MGGSLSSHAAARKKHKEWKDCGSKCWSNDINPKLETITDLIKHLEQKKKLTLKCKKTCIYVVLSLSGKGIYRKVDINVYKPKNTTKPYSGYSVQEGQVNKMLKAIFNA